jgi:hypothetical protein
MTGRIVQAPEPLTIFGNLITCSLTRLTALMCVRRPLTLKLSISQHHPPPRWFPVGLPSLNGNRSRRAHPSATQYSPYPPLRHLLCGPFLVLLCGAPVHLVKPTGILKHCVCRPPSHLIIPLTAMLTGPY